MQELNIYLNNDQNNELDSLRPNEGHRVHPIFKAQKRTAIKYKVTFALIALFFMGLAVFTYNLTPSWISTLYLENSELIKDLISGVSVILGAISFKMFYSICPMKETAFRLLKRAEEKFIKISQNGEFEIDDIYPDVQINPIHEEVIVDRMYELYEESLDLIESISKHKESDNKQKIRWINQTFFDLQAKLNRLICFNQNIDIPQFEEVSYQYQNN